MSGVSSGTQPKHRKSLKKNAKKSIVLDERENVPKMEIVYPNVEEKNISRECGGKKDVRRRSTLLK